MAKKSKKIKKKNSAGVRADVGRGHKKIISLHYRKNTNLNCIVIVKKNYVSMDNKYVQPKFVVVPVKGNDMICTSTGSITANKAKSNSGIDDLTVDGDGGIL